MSEIVPTIVTPKINHDKMYTYAQRIAMGHLGDSYIYCLEEKKFYIYQDGYWRKVFDLDILGNLCTLLPQVNKHSLNSKKQIIGHLQIMIKKELSCFNKTGYLNFKQGEFNPLNCEMVKHDVNNYSTLRMPYDYDRDAKCPLWEKTILEIFEGDINKANMLQEFFGYCLTRDVRKEKALLLLGQSRTGKSTILETLSYMVGEDNCSFVSLDYIFHPQYSPLLMNKLINIDTDVSSKAENFEREFKTITSGEPLVCNQKFVETFKYRPYCKLVLAANEFPRIKDYSSAFYNRLLLLPCDRIFKPEEQDLKLKDKLIQELAGVFNWAVIGLKRLQERGEFETHDFMKEAVQQLEDDNNPTNVFFEEHIVIENGHYEEKGKLFTKYIEWCRETKSYELSAILFGKCIAKKFPMLDKKSRLPNNGAMIWKNLRYVDRLPTQAQKEVTGWNE